MRKSHGVAQGVVFPPTWQFNNMRQNSNYSLQSDFTVNKGVAENTPRIRDFISLVLGRVAVKSREGEVLFRFWPGKQYLMIGVDLILCRERVWQHVRR